MTLFNPLVYTGVAADNQGSLQAGEDVKLLVSSTKGVLKMADAPKVPTVKKADENARQLTVVHKATKKTHVVSRKHYENNKDKYDLA